MDIQRHINEKKTELQQLEMFWRLFVKYSKVLRINSGVFNYVKARVSSNMALIEQSIKDHAELIE